MANAKQDEPDTVSGELVLYDRAMFPNLLNQDPAEVTARFARRFEQAQTIDDLDAILEGTSSQDLVGRVVTMTAVAWAPYESDSGVIPLAIVTAGNPDTGEALEFATTSSMLTMYLRKVEIINAFPITRRIVEKKTRSGRTALNFERV